MRQAILHVWPAERKSKGVIGPAAIPELPASRYKNLDRLHLPPRPVDARGHLRRILDALVDDFGAEKIIAFGSCTRGGATEHSDIDLCVVREHPPESRKPRWEGRMAISAKRPAVPYDLLVIRPSQWREQCARPFGVYDEVVNHGITLYERQPAQPERLAGGR